MKTIRAEVSPFGTATLQFGFDRELGDLVKALGFNWDPKSKRWWGASHQLAALDFAGRTRQVQVAVTWPRVAPAVIVQGARELRPFQTEGVARLLNNPSYMLAWDMRVGKSTAAIVAGASGIATRQFSRMLIFGPATTIFGWAEQIREIFPGLPYAELAGVKNVLALKPECKNEKELRELRRQALELSGAAFVLCQHDLMARRGKDLLWLAGQGLFAAACDEPQHFRDFKAPRSGVLMDVAQHPNCYRRWALSGTPMRNKAADLPVMFEFLGAPPPHRDATRKRSPWNYLIRYAGAREVEHNPETGDSHWEASDVETEPEELKAKLWSFGWRLTREEVAPWLPKAERNVILAKLNLEESKRYKALESRLGKKALETLDGDERASSLKLLAASVLKPKLDAVVERLKFHTEERGVKVIAGMMFHESLEKLIAEIVVQPGETAPRTELKAPLFFAPGWHGPDKRHEQIERWKAHQGPAVLLCSTLANSVGLDLADAGAMVNGELAWVPSDALQWEARVQDIHHGKRSVPPIIEYVLTKGTVDEDMALAMLTKMGAIDRIVGSTDEQRALDKSLRDSGLVNTVDLGLTDRSNVGVEAALDGLRRRLMGEGALVPPGAVSDPSATSISPEALAGDVADAFEDELEEEPAP